MKPYLTVNCSALPHRLRLCVPARQARPVVGEAELSDTFCPALASYAAVCIASGSVYQPAKRGLSWVKLKRDYLEGLADSLDLVPIGAWRGNGRKVRGLLLLLCCC
jgi:hypothetical protein